MDDRVDRAIDAALHELRAAKPAPDFLPRLRAHVERQPRRAPIRWWIPFAASATTVIAGIVVGALMRAPRVEVIQAPPRAATLPSLPVAPAAAPAVATAPAPPARTARRARPALREPDVLVPSGQRAALARLVDALNAGDEQAVSAVRRLGTRTEVTVAPIEIAPLVVVPLKESM